MVKPNETIRAHPHKRARHLVNEYLRLIHELRVLLATHLVCAECGCDVPNRRLEQTVEHMGGI